MSEHEHASKQVDPLANQVIERNGVKKLLIVDEFGKKSNYKGIKFPRPEFSIGDFENDSKWCGLDWVVALMNKSARLIFGDLFVDDDYQKEFSETGKYPWEKWKADAEAFTAGIAKLKDLMDDKEELVAQQQALVADPLFSLGEGEESTPAYVELTEKIKLLGKKIAPLTKQIADIRAKYAARIEKKEAAAAAQKAAQVGQVVSA